MHGSSLGRLLKLRHGDALIVVDVQRDFLPGGSLAVPEGDAVIAPLNDYIRAFESRDLPVIFTRDWHPIDHCSFSSAGGSWPPHCVQETPGAAWAKHLDVTADDYIVSKGMDPRAEAYSGFSGTKLLSLLRELNVHRVFVGGLATDYCVRATVCDALIQGFDVVVLADAIRAVNVQSGDDARAASECKRAGPSSFSRRDRHFEHTVALMREQLVGSFDIVKLEAVCD